MRTIFPFRIRLFLSFWLLVALILFLHSIYYSRTVNRLIFEEARKNSVRQLHLIHWLMMEQARFESAEQLQGWVKNVGENLDIRITYIAEGGRVVADSAVAFSDIPNLDNHSTRPEIVGARSREIGMSTRYSGTLSADLLYVAKSVSGIEAIPDGVLRLAVPYARIRTVASTLDRGFAGIVLLALLVTTSLGYALARRLDRSLRTMNQATEAIGNGEFKQRVHFPPGHEFYPMALSVNRMARRLEAHVRAIVDREQQLDAILNGMQEGIMLLDSEGKIHTVNQAMAAMVPDLPELEGRRPLEVVRSKELQDAFDLILEKSRSAGEDNRPHRMRITLQHANRTYQVNIVGIEDQQRGQGAIAVFHDVTRIKRLEKVRRDFVANVSHELRTPLTSIKGYTETLLAGVDHDPEAARSFLEVILKNANHMTKMVNDLLDLARLESGERTGSAAAVDASEALLAAWRACVPLAQAKRIELQSELPEEGVRVRADFDQLLQVFRNTLENAIRYSPPGEKVLVTCGVEGDEVKFGVLDKGPGIPKTERHRIFERFYRVEKHRGVHSGSTGLGLAICRHIVQNHGGRIWVESPPAGSTGGTALFFTFSAANREGEA